jgi:hypothetical protein
MESGLLQQADNDRANNDAMFARLQQAPGPNL